MIPVEEAKLRILAGLVPVGSETVSVSDASGRVLAEDLVPRLDNPPFPVSAMDGYACRAEDLGETPVDLTVAGTVSAGGEPFPRSLQAGETVRIFTGAAVPQGADTIVIQENVTSAEQAGIGNAVRINQSEPRGRHIRPAGGDFTRGEIAIRAGTVLTSRHIALAAAMNHPWLRVRRKPRIAILATGDELARPGDPVSHEGDAGPHIIESNSHLIASLCRAAGAEAQWIGVAGDDVDSLTRIARDAAHADLLVTSGGASVGDHDLVREVLGGGESGLEFWKVAMRPGKPVMFGPRLKADRPAMLGLPGNPVSAFVCGLLFLTPAIHALQGIPESSMPLPVATCLEPLKANGEREVYLRAWAATDAQGKLTVQPHPDQDSAKLSVLAESNCLLKRAPGADALEAGALVPVLFFSNPLSPGLI